MRRIDSNQNRWLVPAVLAVPFVVMIAALRGMTVALQIFHGSDELVYHYPTIIRFAHELPFPDLHSYHAAQTPLFHLLMAYVGKLTGYELWRLRLVQLLISYLLALAVFDFLARRLRMQRSQALALTLLFVLSPYVFGQSFRLVTDNLALLFSVLALERFERFREHDRLPPFLWGCALMGAAMLTRQSTGFLVPVAIAYALVRPISRGRRAAALSAVALAVVPLSLLVISWHGLVPVGGDPAACGLCARKGPGGGFSLSGLELPTMELALATIGLYGAVLFAPVWIPEVRNRLATRDRLRNLIATAHGPLIAAGAGAVLLVIFPATPGPQAAGDIWKAAGHLPALDGSSLLFWALVPLSGAVLWLRLRCAPRPFLTAVFAACFLISTIATRDPLQKYVDPLALLILLTTVRRAELGTPRRLAGAAVLTLAFLAYAADYSSHRSIPRSHGTSTAKADQRTVTDTYRL